MPDNLIGQTLGRYVILRLLGEDSMGTVYKAHDPTLERDVALRIIHLALANQPGFGDRFTQAARLAARLDHPNLVEIFDFGEVRSYHYLVMEYVPGDNLAALLDSLRQAGNWIPLPEALHLVRQTALALEYLRSQGAAPRAVQPADVYIKPVRSEGLPYLPVLTGAGLAGLTEVAPNFQVSEPAYLSPEGSLGRSTDARSDVYSLGVLLYELCTGQLPFPVRTVEEAVRYHTRQPAPSPRSIRAELPEGLERVILTALEKNPAARISSPAALAIELENLAPSVSQINTAPPALVSAVSLLGPYQASLVDENFPAGFEETIAPPPATLPSRPKEQAAEPLEIWMDSPQLSVEPGSSVSTVVTLRNNSQVEGNFRLNLDGAPSAWVFVAPPVVRLLPGEQRGITLTIQPPREAQSRAGRYPLTIRAADQRDPALSAVVKGTLTVAVFYEFASRLYTPRLNVNETGQLAISNHGNTQETFTVFLRDPAGELVFTPPQAQIRLAEGQAGAVEFRSEPAQARWIGSERLHPFSAQVVASVGETQTHTGEFVSRAILPVWVIGLFLVALLCAAGFLTLLLSRSGVQVSSATATAFAQQTGVAFLLTSTAEAGTATAESLANANQATIQAVTATAAWQAADPDQDGLSNQREAELGTLPNELDSDRDGLGDGDEVNRKTDPLRPDSDGDSLSDGTEVSRNLDPLKPDTDGDGIPDAQDTDPLQTSTSTPNLAATAAAATAAFQTVQASTQQAGSVQTAAVQTAQAGTAAAANAATAAANTAAANAAATAAAGTAAANAATAAAGTAAANATAAAATATAQAGGAMPPTSAVPVRAAFVFGTTTSETQAFEALLEANNFQVDMIKQSDIYNADFSPYSVILLASNTGEDDQWGPEPDWGISLILDTGLPVLGIGQGGYSFFGDAGLVIGWQNGQVTEGTDIMVVDPANPVWSAPSRVSIPANRVLTLYSAQAQVVSISVPAAAPNLTFIASRPDASDHYPLIRQDRFLLWGFGSGPERMTPVGQQLFINLVRSLLS